MKANHNYEFQFLRKWFVVRNNAKSLKCKQITTHRQSDYMEESLFPIMQRYYNESKSQPTANG